MEEWRTETQETRFKRIYINCRRNEFNVKERLNNEKVQLLPAQLHSSFLVTLILGKRTFPSCRSLLPTA